ncbi:hypothetical protein H5410_028361 [Solanum commersonii]|uniref:Uncharacterized protein n=1 Tax=Solanum commersonii TaxID=4109 RepID=A0A9J5Z3T5_SOLCO|nr:hypothetical protein H5410_028361 [Solanum commersonii]
MAPKSKNVAGSKRSRKGVASESTQNEIQEQYEVVVLLWRVDYPLSEGPGDRGKGLRFDHCFSLGSDGVMARMFGMAELQLRIGGCPVTNVEIETMVERYPLSESADFLCKTGPTFSKPLDDDEATADEKIDDEEENDVVEGGLISPRVVKKS